LQNPRRGPFFSIRRRETCQAAEEPSLKALVRAFLVELHILLVCGYVFAFFTLFLDAPGPSRRAPSSGVEQHGVRWSMGKVKRDNEALSSKRVGSQRCLSMKLVKLLNLAASKRPYSVAHRVWRYCKDDCPCEWHVDSSGQYGTDAPIVDASCHGSEDSKNGNTTELRMNQSHRPS